MTFRHLSVTELAAVEKCTASGRLTQTLQDLRHAGFVSRDRGLNPETGGPALSVRTVLVYDGELDVRIEAEHAFDFVIPSSLLVKQHTGIQ